MKVQLNVEKLELSIEGSGEDVATAARGLARYLPQSIPTAAIGELALPSMGVFEPRAGSRALEDPATFAPNPDGSWTAQPAGTRTFNGESPTVRVPAPKSSKKRRR